MNFKNLEIMTTNNFKIGDIITFYGSTNGISNGGISFGEIIEINGERARVVTGGIDLNTTNHFKPNYMVPVRVRPIIKDDYIYNVTLSTAKTIDNTNWGTSPY